MNEHERNLYDLYPNLYSRVDLLIKVATWVFSLQLIGMTIGFLYLIILAGKP